MRAMFAALEGRRFDLLVIGGGITGAGIARDAAMRGLSVAIVDKGDWGSGTSSRSSRLVHGGIRYLEHGEIALVRESVREREVLMRIAPHLVKPLEFTWPVYRGARLPRWKLRAGLALYDVLAGSRGSRKHHGLDVESIVEHEPMLRRDGLVGGATYHDAATDDVRLTLANVLSAVEHGAVAVNYARVVPATWIGRRVDGAVVRDELGDAEVRVSARVTVSATGPWQAKGTKGVHITVPAERVGNRGAVTMVNPVDGRVMFVLPSGTQTIVGTTDTFTDAVPDEVRASEADVEYLLAAANSYFPDAELAEEDVVAAWAGIRPLAAAASGADPSEISREHRIAEDAPGVITVSGGKLTTYRSMAAEVVEEAVKLLRSGEVGGVAGGASGLTGVFTAEEPLPGEDRRQRVGGMAKSDPVLRRGLVYGLPYTFGDVEFAVRHEMAVTVGDVLVRRTHVAFETRDHGIGVAGAVAGLMAPVLGWSEIEETAHVELYAAEVGRIFAIDAAYG
ncbi:MAG: glycerol-3-phosphate dehydrogenase/oxidase [Gemmatimonadaceae bacterium]